MSDPATVAAVQQRIVPGAPPPKAPTKSQKKKRKGKGGKDEPAIADATSAALVETAPETPADVAPELAAPEEAKVAVAQTAPEVPLEEGEKKKNPLIEVIHKRLKVHGGKLVSSSQCWWM